MSFENDRQEYLCFLFLEKVFESLSLQFSITRKTMYSVLCEASEEYIIKLPGWKEQNLDETRILKRINRILEKYISHHEDDNKISVIAQGKIYDFVFKHLGEIQSKYCLSLDIQNDKYARFIRKVKSDAKSLFINKDSDIHDRNGLNIYECILLSILYPTVRSRSLNIIDNTAKSQTAYSLWVKRVNDLIASRSFINSIFITFFDTCYSILEKEVNDIYEILMRKFWLLDGFKERVDLDLAVNHIASRYDRHNFPSDDFTDEEVLLFNELNERYSIANQLYEIFIPLISMMINHELPIVESEDRIYFDFERLQYEFVSCYKDVVSDFIEDTEIMEGDYLLASKLSVNIIKYIFEAIEAVIYIILEMPERKELYFDNKNFCIKFNE